jgi:hypothetical protein
MIHQKFILRVGKKVCAIAVLSLNKLFSRSQNVRMTQFSIFSSLRFGCHMRDATMLARVCKYLLNATIF